MKKLFIALIGIMQLPVLAHADVLCEQKGQVQLVRKATQCPRKWSKVDLNSLVVIKDVTGQKGDTGAQGIQGIQGLKVLLALKG